MRPTLSPTRNEVKLGFDELIISKTDTAGRITYANKVFMRICDFPEEALLGQPHNIIRHPDMPRGVFHGLWSTLKQGREFFGLVKNMTARGDFYWVMANVRPDFIGRQCVGYFSVRRCPARALIAQIEPLYQQMLALEKQGGPDVPQRSWQWLTDQLARQGTDYERFFLGLVAQTKESRP